MLTTALLAGARADRLPEPVAAGSSPPAVMVLTELVGPGINRYDLATLQPDGARRPILEDMPKVKPTAKPTLSPRALMSNVTPIGDDLYYVRRDPAPPQPTWVERYDLTTKQVTRVFQLPAGTPDWSNSAFLSTGPRQTVLFTHDPTFARGDLYEARVGDATPTRIARDVPDPARRVAGRPLRPVQPVPGSEPEPGRHQPRARLVILDLVTRRAIELDPEATMIRAARFITRPAASPP